MINKKSIDVPRQISRFNSLDVHQRLAAGDCVAGFGEDDGHGARERGRNPVETGYTLEIVSGIGVRNPQE